MPVDCANPTIGGERGPRSEVGEKNDKFDFGEEDTIGASVMVEMWLGSSDMLTGDCVICSGMFASVPPGVGPWK